MIVVQLRGGLGNQLFQYALGKNLADANKTTLTLDTSYLQSKLPLKKIATPMQYELSIFNIRAAISSNFIKSSPWLYPFAKAEYIVRELWHKNRYHIVQETQFNFDQTILKSSDNSFLIGNFQSESYFKNITQELRKDFTFLPALDKDNQEWMAKIKQKNSVSIHIRRGDYLSIAKNAQKFTSLSLEYYKNAISVIAAQISNPEFFVFSDDVQWVQQNLKLDFPTFFVTNNHTPTTAYLDMQLMSACKHHIIANSTFSWWGAWLNPNSDKIVITPKQWFTDTSINSKDICPIEWIKL